MVRAIILAVAFTAWGSLASGCKAKKVTVRGKVTFASAPVKGTEREPVVIRFTKVEESKNSQVFEAQVNQDEGTYTVQLPPGKYQVSVAHFNSGLEDEFGGAFAEGASPITREVKGSDELDFDLKAEGGQSSQKESTVPEHPH